MTKLLWRGMYQLYHLEVGWEILYQIPQRQVEVGQLVRIRLLQLLQAKDTVGRGANIPRPINIWNSLATCTCVLAG